VVAATATAPELCDVRGYVAPQVQFELKLPARTWQGRYLQFGCGGFCGAIGQDVVPVLRPPAGRRTSPWRPRTTATPPRAPTRCGGDRRAESAWTSGPAPFTCRGVASKAIIAAFYGTAPQRSYFNGCSDGGREALQEAQRFPADFDGIVAGAPASIWAPLNGEFQPWVGTINVDGQGNPILTAAKLPALHRGGRFASCDGVDGLVDGQIDDPRACRFDPASIGCPSGVDQPTCLTPGQVEVARKAYEGPVDARGRHLYPGGEPAGSELAWAGWFVTPAGAPGIGTLSGDSYLRYSAFPIGQPRRRSRTGGFTLDGFDRLRAEGRVFGRDQRRPGRVSGGAAAG